MKKENNVSKKIKNAGKNVGHVTITFTKLIIIFILLITAIFGGLVFALMPLWLWIGNVSGWAWAFFATGIGISAAFTSIGRIINLVKKIVFRKKPNPIKDEEEIVEIIIVKRKK